MGLRAKKIIWVGLICISVLWMFFGTFAFFIWGPRLLPQYPEGGVALIVGFLAWLILMIPSCICIGINEHFVGSQIIEPVPGEKLSRAEALAMSKQIPDTLERLETHPVGRVVKTKNLTRREDGHFGCFEHDGEHRFIMHKSITGYFKWISSCGEKLTPKEWWQNLLTFGRLRGSKYDPTPPPTPPPPTPPRPVPEVPQVIREREIREVVLVLCPYCGTKNQQGTIKCSHCGASI